MLGRPGIRIPLTREELADFRYTGLTASPFSVGEKVMGSVEPLVKRGLPFLRQGAPLPLGALVSIAERRRQAWGRYA